MPDDKIILNIEANVDTAKAKKDLDSFNKNINNINGKVITKADFSSEQAKSKISTYKKLLASITKTVKSNVSVDMASATRDVKKLQTVLDSLKNNKYSVNINTNVKNLDTVVSKLDKIDKNVNIKFIDNSSAFLARLDKIQAKLKELSKPVRVSVSTIEAGRRNSRRDVESIGDSKEEKHITYARQGQAAQVLADKALQEGNAGSFKEQISSAAELYNKADMISNAIKNQKTNLRANNDLLHDQMQSLSQIEQDWKSIIEQRVRAGDTSGADKARGALWSVQSQRLNLSQYMQENTFKGLDSQIKGVQAKISSAISNGAKEADLTDFYKQLVTLTSERVRVGLQSGQLSRNSAISAINKVSPIADRLGERYKDTISSLRDDFNLNTVPAEQNVKKVQNTFSALRREAVVTIDAINSAWENGRGTNKEEAELDRILAKMREIKREEGTLSSNYEKRLYSGLSNGVNRNSRGYEILTNKIKAINPDITSERSSNNFGMSGAEKGAYITRFLGRSSKGVGSFGEAFSQLTVDVGKLGGGFSSLADAMGGVSAAVAIVAAAINAVVGAASALSSVLGTAGALLVSFLRPGFEVMNQTNTATLSLTAALQSMSTVNGQAATKDQARAASVNLLNQAMRDAQKSAFSYKEIVEAMQGVMPVLLGKGMNAQQAYNITTGVAGVAKLTQLAPNQVLQETRDLAQGSITAGHSQVANALGISNDDLKQYKGNSDALFNYLMNKFEGYSKALGEFSNTPEGAIQQFEDTVSLTGAVILDKFGAPITEMFQTLTGLMGSFNEKTNEFELSPGMQEFANVLQDIALYAADCIDSIINLAGSITSSNTVAKQAEDIIKGIIGTLTFLIETLIFFIYEAIGAYYIIKIAAVSIADAFGAIGDAIEAAYHKAVAFKDALSGDLKGASEENALADSKMGQAKNNLVSITDIKGMVLGTTDDAAGSVANFLSPAGIGDSHTVHDFLLKAIEDGKNKKKDNPKDGDPSQFKGNAKEKDDAKARAKAEKAAIQQSQKDLKDNREKLKTILEDELEELKDILEKNDIANKEGFLSNQDNYAAKAQNAIMVASKNLEEREAERALIENAKYSNESDRDRDLQRVAKEINKYTKELNKAIVGQKEVAEVTSQNTLAMHNLISDMLSHKNDNIASATGTTAKVATSWDTLFKVNPQTLKDRQNWMMQAFMLSGYSKENAAGAVGNVTYESGNNLDPTVDSPYAHGIVQWDNDRWKNVLEFARENNSDPRDFRTQVMALLHEIQQGTEQGNYLNTQRSVAQASYDFGANVERPDKDAFASSLQARTDYAQKAYDSFDIPVFVKLGETIGNTTYGGITSALDTALSKNGGNLLYAQMPHLRKGCVEAATQLGSYFSTALKAANEAGIADTDSLDAKLEQMGVPSDNDTSKLNPGDTVFFDTNQVNGHVLLVKDAKNYVGNSSGLINPLTGTESGITEQEIASYGSKINHIRRTGSFGLASGFGNPTSLNQTRPDTTKIAEEIRSEYIKDIIDLQSLFASNESRVFGSYYQQIQQIYAEYSEKIRTGKVKYTGEGLDAYLNAMKTELQLKVNDKMKDIISEVADVNLKILERNAPIRGYEIQTGQADFNTLVSKYLGYIDKVNSDSKYWVGNQIQMLEKIADTYEAGGDVKVTLEIREKIADLRSKVLSLVSSWIDNIAKKYDYADARFENVHVTGLQKDQGQADLKQYRNQELFMARAELEQQYIASYQEHQSIIDRAKELQQTFKPDSKEYSQQQSAIELEEFEMKRIQMLATENHQQMMLNKELGRYIDLLGQAKNAGKQAIEDGLVTFLTDGITEAKSLSEAIYNLASSILKSMQQFFAKKLVLSLMQKWFPAEEDNGKRTSVEGLSSDVQWKPFKNTSDNLFGNIMGRWYNPSQADPFVRAYNKINPATPKFDVAAPADTKSIFTEDEPVSTGFNSLASSSQILQGAFQSLQLSAQSVANALQNMSFGGIRNGKSDTPVISNKYATGGFVSGAGTGTSDSVPSMLSNGEFVVKAKAVKQYGLNLLHSINSGSFSKIPVHVPHFADGGLVGNSESVGNEALESTARGISGLAQKIGTNVSTTTNVNVALVRDENEAFASFLKSGKGKNIMLDFSRKTARLTNKIIGNY